MKQKCEYLSHLTNSAKKISKRNFIETGQVSVRTRQMRSTPTSYLHMHGWKMIAFSSNVDGEKEEGGGEICPSCYPNSMSAF